MQAFEITFSGSFCIKSVYKAEFFLTVVGTAIGFYHSYDPVDQTPYAAATDSDQLKYTQSDLASYETIYSEFSEEKTEYPTENVFIYLFFHNISLPFLKILNAPTLYHRYKKYAYFLAIWYDNSYIYL